MAVGTKSELWLMEMLIRDPGPLSSLLTPEQADEMEKRGWRVARIPVVKRD